MANREIDDQLVSYLTDIHSTEANAVAQLRDGADASEEPALSEALRSHLTETEEHERLIAQRLEAHGASPSSAKDLVQKAAAKLTGAAAKAAPDTSGKLAIESFAFEHLEIASYRMLIEVARRAGDEETVTVAQRILGEEQQAAEKLGGLLEQVAASDLERQVA